MLAKRLFSTCLSLLSSLSVFGTKLETDSISEIKHHLDPTQKTLVVFDIDNTLAWTGHELGSDQWFSYMWQQKKREGLNEHEIIAAILPLYIEVHNNSPLIPVEEKTPKLVAMLQKQNIPSMALTSRSLPLKERTFEQLADITIDFSRNQLFQDELDLSGEFPALYSNGIIFSSNNNKGTLLINFLKHAGYKPEKIIFVDDKQKYVDVVETAVEAAGIEYVGIRYTRLDDTVKNFNPTAADEQLEQFFQEHPDLVFAQ